MFCLATNYFNKCHCGKLQCFLKMVIQVMFRGLKAFCIVKKWFQIAVPWNSWRYGRMNMIKYDRIQPKSLVFKKFLKKLLACIFKPPTWAYNMLLLTGQIPYYIWTQPFYLLKKSLHNTNMQSQHLYWCKCCDSVAQSCWRPGLSKLRHTGRRSPQQGPQTVEWKATSILAQTTSVTQIRQAQCTGSLSPAAGGGQADLHRMETFSWT